MCTLVIARNLFKGFPIVVASNRDELLDRPSEPARICDGIGHKILTPRDLQRFGSWIGVNEFGVFAGLTNRIDIVSTGGKMSRGDLVMQALRHHSAKEALISFRDLVADMFNAFHLIIADRNSMFLIKSDGRRIERTYEESGLLVVTNHGVGRSIGLGVPKRIGNIMRCWYTDDILQGEPTVENIKKILEIHDGWRHGTCISEPENNYGTKSSAIIRYRSYTGYNVWEYNHRERKDFKNHICVDNFDPTIYLPIINP